MYSNNIQDQQYTKESITILADEAKTQISQNKYLLEIIGIFNQQISLVKSLIKSCSSHTIQQKNGNNNPALNYKNHLSLLNAKLKEEINKNNKKYENMINNFSKDSSEANQSMSQFYIDNFILNNTINKLDYEIKMLNKKIESSKKYDIFREPRRETEIDIKESKTLFLVCNLEFQQKMLSFCRSYANNKFKNIKKESKIKESKKQIALLKKYINYYSYKLYGDETKGLNYLFNNKSSKKNRNQNVVDIKKRIGTTPNYKKQFAKIEENNKIIEEEVDKKEEEKNENNVNDTSFNKTSFINDSDLSLFKNINNDEKNKNKTEEKTERKRINILNIDELLDIENIEVEDEDIIDNELNSDDEVFFEKKIKPKKKIKTDFLSDLKKNVPSINLSQIEFNKLKVINEADAYSLQKRKFEQGNINGQINNIKKQIKHMEKKIGINRKKLKVIHNFIEDVKYNYKLLRPIKVQTSAAGNPVHYIREKLLNIVEETITQSEKKEIKENDKFKTGKTAVEEGEEYDDQLVGSDYSDEDEYLDNFDNKENEVNNNSLDGKQNINNIIKQKKSKIKTNLITKFELNEKEDEEEVKNNYFYKDIKNDYNNNILENTIAQSK